MTLLQTPLQNEITHQTNQFLGFCYHAHNGNILDGGTRLLFRLLPLEAVMIKMACQTPSFCQNTELKPILSTLG